MSKVHIGVGDDFPVNEATGPEAHPCGRRRAYWAARRAARRERWRAWCEYWRGQTEPERPHAPPGDASYTDVPPPDKKDSAP
jgi:hypothetical protein